jgi:hypothetical protein
MTNHYYVARNEDRYPFRQLYIYKIASGWKQKVKEKGWDARPELNICLTYGYPDNPAPIAFSEEDAALLADIMWYRVVPAESFPSDRPEATP